MFKILRCLEISFFICSITIISLITFIGCDTFSYKGINEGKTETINNIYFNYPVRDYPIGNSNNSTIYWDSSENDFGNYLGEYNRLIYDGFHPGEDWNLKGGKDGEIDNGLPVYSIGIGKVIKISDLGSLGYLVVIEHDGNFVIPAKEISSNGQKASYEKEVVDKIYSVYIHLKDIEVNENDKVTENTIIGYIMNPGGNSHLHFEIRKNNDNHSSNWSLLGNNNKNEAIDKNWQFNLVPDKNDPSKRVKDYNGYYINLQEMIDAGLRDPSDFIEANEAGNKVAKESYQTIPEQSFSLETETIAETNSSETSANDTLKISDKIAFTSKRNGIDGFFIMNIDGSEQTRLKNSPDSEDRFSCSADCHKIVYTGWWDRDYEISVCYEIYVTNIDFSEQTRLTYSSAIDCLPSFSPDGSKIVFASDRDGDFEIYIMNADGSDQKRLTYSPDYDDYPSFSPNGSKIVFSSERDGNDNKEIYIMNVDGSGQTRLTNNPASDDDGDPCFSPDGSKIAFSSDRDESDHNIYIMNVDGSGQTRLTNNPACELKPCFSPDGSKIAFESLSDYNYEIYIMNVDGSGQTRLTYNPYYDAYPFFTH